MTSEDTFECDVEDLTFHFILEYKTGFAFEFPQILMPTQTRTYVFQRLDLPQSDIRVLRTACQVKNLLILLDRAEGKGSEGVQVPQERKFILKYLLVGVGLVGDTRDKVDVDVQIIATYS